VSAGEPRSILQFRDLNTGLELAYDGGAYAYHTLFDARCLIKHFAYFSKRIKKWRRAFWVKKIILSFKQRFDWKNIPSRIIYFSQRREDRRDILLFSPLMGVFSFDGCVLFQRFKSKLEGKCSKLHAPVLNSTKFSSHEPPQYPTTSNPIQATSNPIQAT